MRIQKADIYQRKGAREIIFETLRLHYERGSSMLYVEMKNEHTQTPWEVSQKLQAHPYIAKNGMPLAFTCAPRKCAEDRLEGECWLSMRIRTEKDRAEIAAEESANAAHIVKCVNSHDELLAFADKIARVYCDCGERSQEGMLAAEARSLIANAEKS